MSIERIHQALHTKFQENRIVFWYDDSKEFEGQLPELSIAGVKVINLGKTGSFQTKLTLEVLEPQTKFLLYAPFAKPNNPEDILLDIFLYSSHFSADSAEIVRDELELQDVGTREFIKERLSFFSATRKSKLKLLLDGSEDDTALGIRMLQVILGSRGNSCSEIMLSLFGLVSDQDNYTPKELTEIIKFQLQGLLWKFIEEEFGYSSEKQNLQGLLYSLVATEITLVLGSSAPSALRSLAVTAPHKASHATVFMTTWRDSETFQASYAWHLGRCDQELKLNELLEPIPSNQLLKLQTSESAERLLLTRSRELVTHDSTQKSIDEAELIITGRKNSYWSIKKSQNFAAYQAMHAALSFVRLKEEYPNGFHAFDPKSFVDLYIKDLYRFDELYRHYYQFLASESVAGSLVTLTTRVEELYAGWFLPTLASAWSPFVENSLLNNWEIPGIVNQVDFYSRVIRPLLNSNPKPRVAVIISDALRYEVARELTSQINKRDNIQADITCLLSVLPSHTALGMAALLPHTSLDYDQTGNVFVDGKSAQGFANREQILQSAGALAFSAEDIKSQPREELRARIGEASLLYIYHNRIDDTGDKLSSEKETFTAVSETLQELDSIIGKVLNSLNCSVVVVTADHGFIYSSGELAETDRSELKILSGTPIIEKKRYVVGTELETNDKCWRSNTSITAATTTKFDILTPRGINRFHFKGGARYFHGGAMLQEVIIPAVTCKKHRDKAAEITKTSKVDVILLSLLSNITSPRQSLKFIQTELTSEKLLGRGVTVGFYDDKLEPVSDIHKLIFDANAENPGRREQSVTFAFKAIRFNQSKDYYLRIVNQDSDFELARQAVKIKILIADEFI